MKEPKTFQLRYIHLYLFDLCALNVSLHWSPMGKKIYYDWHKSSSWHWAHDTNEFFETRWIPPPVYRHQEHHRSTKSLNYRQISNISHTKSQTLHVSRLVLHLSLPNPLKPNVTSIMKMYLDQRRQAMLQLHLSDQQFHCLLGCVLQ